MSRFQLFYEGKKFAALLFFSSVLFCTQSCKKEDASSSKTNVSEEEVAEAVTQSMNDGSSGMIAEYSRAQVVTSVQEGKLKCGESATASVSRSNEDGAVIKYTASVSWTWKFNCVTPANIAFTSKGHIKYDAPKMSSDDSSHAEFIITGIGSASQYNLNGVYTRNGSQQSKIGNKNSFTSTIIITSENVKINKSTRIIDGGTATIAVTGASTSGKSFVYAGTLTFLDNKKATLVIVGGGTYNLSW